MGGGQGGGQRRRKGTSPAGHLPRAADPKQPRDAAPPQSPITAPHQHYHTNQPAAQHPYTGHRPTTPAGRLTPTNDY
ncbi:hypothetical protein E2C01_056958 [Portunus trituberculatus]|uniref:Uncharacterized protein n=1 Tax=Portunus trituberculatus TaxID=210409 RepID=A0A5B7H108_PORTR|nr:hypothetical protein [Portunus trituberculatus]